MRDFKPLLCLGDSTVIRHTIGGLRAAGVDHIVVVTGYQSAVLERHLIFENVMFIKNERFAQTDMLTSIQLGLSALPSDAERVFVTPADVPLVSPDTLGRMLGCRAQVVRPVYQGRGGHPLLLQRDAVEQVLAWQGPNGLKGLLYAGTLQVVDLEVDDPGILMDADTPQDYKRLLHYQSRLQGHGNLRMDLQLNIGMEDLFLTTENVQLLDMIEQTGSLQGACACMHISYSKGWKAINTMERELGYPVADRVAGGAEGGGSSLTEQGKQLLTGYRALHRELSEQAQLLFEKYFPEDLRCSGKEKEEA
jgi:molybdate transport repressor ModE-like protein